MKKILYIATTADNRNRLDGETVKCRLLREYLNEIEDIRIYSVDTDNWKKHILKLVVLILFYFMKTDEIIVSSADKGANIILDFFRKIKTKKKIYYFVIGGSLSRNIKEKKWNVNTYKNVKRIFVEATTLKEELNKLEINNVEVLNNFRKVKKFKNNYKNDGTFKFVYYGRVIKEKGIEEAIKLVKKLKENKIKCTLDIYGQCNDEYLNKIKREFDEKIVFHGEIKPDCKTEYEILSQYDVFIFPTEYPGECLPGALIDCYIANLAVVASDWKYAREYILDNENGKIFEYKNYEDMYNKTLELIKENSIEKYKQKSGELSKKYMLDELLNDFKKELKYDNKGVKIENK